MLIAVPDYEAAAVPNLPFAANDVASLAESLKPLGYEVSLLGAPDATGDVRSATRNRIISAVFETCRSASADDVVLIYFSGHGLHTEGRDYLVPADAEIREDVFEELLVPVDFARAVEGSQASAVLFFIDACREGVELGAKGALTLQNWSEGKLDTVSGKQCAYVFACAPGEVSRYVGGPEGFSLFGRALADALNGMGSKIPFGQFRAALQSHLDELADRHQKKRQVVKIVAETGASATELNAIELARSRADDDRAARYSRLPALDWTPLAGYTVTPVDAKLLSRSLRGEPPWLAGPVSVSHLLRASATLGMPVKEVVENLGRFEPVGITLPAIPAGVVDELEVTSGDLEILDIRERFSSNEFRSDDTISVSDLVLISHSVGKSIGFVLERLERLAHLGLTLPDVAQDAVFNEVVTDRDLDLLSDGVSGREPWYLGNSVPVGHVLAAARRHSMSARDVATALGRFEGLGVVLPDMDWDRVSDSEIRQSDLVMLSVDLDGQWPWIGSDVSATHLMRAAFHLERTVGEVLMRVERLQDARAVGLDGVPLPDDRQSLDALTVTSQDLRLLGIPVERELEGEEFEAIDGELPAAHLLAASGLAGCTVVEAAQRVREFAPLGLRVASVDTAQIPSRLKVSSRDLVAISRDRDGEPPFLTGPIPLVHILRASAALSAPVAEVVALVRAFEPFGIALPSDTASDDFQDVVPGEHLGVFPNPEFAQSFGTGGMYAEAANDPREIDRYAILRAARYQERSVGSVVEGLISYEQVGMRLPDGDLAALTDLIISDEDLLVLSRDLDAVAPWISGRVTGTHVLRAASSIGEPVDRILSRLERLAPAAGVSLHASYSKMGAYEPTADDFVVLSAGLNGHAPWIPTRVPPLHLVRAAQAMGTSLRETVEHLGRFEPLGLEIPALDLSELTDIWINEDDVKMLSQKLDLSGPWYIDEIPASHILWASNQLDKPVGELITRLERLRPLGIGQPSPRFSATGSRRRVGGRRRAEVEEF